MDYRRTAFVTCIFALSGLGISGALAEGCGGDDTAAPATGGGTAGTGGTGGAAGSGGSSAGRGGSSAGSGGRADSGPVDAPSDVDYRAICLAGADAGSSCLNMCICDNCGRQAVDCFASMSCRAIVDCANSTMCNPDPTAANSCFLPALCGMVIQANPTGLAAAVTLGNCVTPAMCNTKCAPDGEAGSDAPVTSDAPPTGDARAVDTGSRAETGAETGAD